MKNQKSMLSNMISEKKLLELWKIKLIVYALRDATWIRKMAFAPILVLIVDAGLSELKKSVVLFIFLISLIYILISIGIYRKILSVQSKKKRIDNPYPLIAVLHSAFDLASLLVLVVAFLLMTVLMIQNLSAAKWMLNLIIALLLVVVSLSILFSPKILTSKSLSQMNNEKSTNRLLCSDPKKLDRKVAIVIKLMPLGFELSRGQILQG